MAAGENWVLFQGGQKVGTRSTRSAAQGLIERPFRSGNALLLNIKTGEEWERRHGSWFKNRASWPRTTSPKAAMREGAA